MAADLVDAPGHGYGEQATAVSTKTLNGVLPVFALPGLKGTMMPTDSEGRISVPPMIPTAQSVKTPFSEPIQLFNFDASKSEAPLTPLHKLVQDRSRLEQARRARPLH